MKFTKRLLLFAKYLGILLLAAYLYMVVKYYRHPMAGPTNQPPPRRLLEAMVEGFMMLFATILGP